jgi:queuosine precursor transporter
MDKRITLFGALSAVFLTALVLAETTGGKLLQFSVGDTLVFTMTMGVIPFPITFLVTDIINEYYGRNGIRFVTFLGMGMVVMALVILQIDMAIPAAVISPVKDEAFNGVFGVSARIFAGSLIAYVIGQLVDISVFHALRERTGGKMLWLRATGSTVVSQLIDSFVVLTIAFLGTLSMGQILQIGLTNYIYKFLIALSITPFLYLVHVIVDRYLGKELAEQMMREAHPSVPHASGATPPAVEPGA